MPLALLAALVSSFAIHAAALLLPDVDLSTAPEPLTITAEIHAPPPSPPAAGEVRKPKTTAPDSRHQTAHRPTRQAAKVAAIQPTAPAEAVPAEPPPPAPLEAAEVPPSTPTAEADPAPEPVVEAKAEAAAPAPVDPPEASRGFIRFDVFRGGQGLLVGRAEHRWEFEDGHYRLTAVTETVGLAALVKPVRIELESRGELTSTGLQPEHFTTRRNGAETQENADFDWGSHEVVLGRDGSRRHVADGAQDLLSFHYQLGYLKKLKQGVTMGVATGKKYERYHFDALGAEDIQTPAGFFRTLHLKVQTDTTTELWLAADRQWLPVKIRFTDKKGESFEQVATEMGM